MQVTYGKLRDARGTPGPRQVFTVKKHEQIFADGVGIAMLYDVNLDEDGRVPIIPEIIQDGERIVHVDPSTIRPLSSFQSEYEVNRLVNMISNQNKLRSINIQPLTTPQAPKKRPASKGPAIPATERTTRSKAPRGPPNEKDDEVDHAGGHGEVADGDDEVPVAAEGTATAGAGGGAPDEAPAAAEGAAAEGAAAEGGGAPNGGAPDGGAPAAGPTQEDKNYFMAGLAAHALEMKQWFKAELDKRDDALRREFNLGQQASKGSKKQKEPSMTKATARAVGWDWCIFKANANSDDEDDGVRKSAPAGFDQATVDKMVKPYIEGMIEHVNDWFQTKLGPKKPQMLQEDIMRTLFLSIESKEPSADFLLDLVDAGRFVVLRHSANRVARDLKNRFFHEIPVASKQAVTADAISTGTVHSTETLFTSKWAPTISSAYGMSNRKSADGEEFVVAAPDQHLPFWSETTSCKNVTTGAVMMVPFAGGGIFTDLVSNLRCITLDACSIIIAYCVAKEYGINLNHGFLLSRYAQDWKTW